MRFAAQSLLLLVMLAANALGPGLLALRPIHLKPHERFCAAVGLSQFIAFLIGFALFVAKAPNVCYWLITVVGLLSTIAARRELRKLLAHPLVRAQVWTFAVVFVLAGCMLAIIRHYSGALWAGDWIEHYDRARFFLEHHPLSEIFIDVYTLPARPPMMNVLAAAYMGQLAESSFAFFQLIFLFLNVLAVLPCVMLLPLFGARHLRIPLIVLTFLLASNPVLMQNLTFTWTRMLTDFYLLLGLWFYLRGWRKNDAKRMVFAFASLAVATLVHYSAGPWIVVLLLHYGLVVLTRRPHRWMEPIVAGVISALILFTWFGWSLAMYGKQQTFASNTTVGLALPAHMTRGQLIAENLYASLVPHPLGIPFETFASNFQQVSALGFLRDYTFTIYQQNVLFGFGSVLGFVLLWRVIRFLLDRRAERSLKIFWTWLIIGVTVLGIAVVSSYEPLGIAHICLQPLVLAGLAFVSAQFSRFGFGLRVIIFVGGIIDFVLGVFLQASMESRVFELKTFEQGGKRFLGIVGAGLSTHAAKNWQVKFDHQLVFLGDLLHPIAPAIEVVMVGLFIWLAYRMMLVCRVRRRLARPTLQLN